MSRKYRPETHYHVADLILGTRQDAQRAAHLRLQDKQRELKAELGTDWHSYAQAISEFVGNSRVVACDLACV